MFFFSTAKPGLGSALAAQERHKSMISALTETIILISFQNNF